MVEIRMDCHRNMRRASAQVGSRGGGGGGGVRGGGGGEAAVLACLDCVDGQPPLRCVLIAERVLPRRMEDAASNGWGARRVGERPLRAGMQV
jgi:hypothetical protein